MNVEYFLIYAFSIFLGISCIAVAEMYKHTGGERVSKVLNVIGAVFLSVLSIKLFIALVML